MATRPESPPAPFRATVGGAQLRATVRDVVELTKPRVQLLLLLTTVATMYAVGDPTPGLVVLTVLGGSLSSGGAGAVNHWFDRDIDAGMQRTAERPVVAGRITPEFALTLGLTMGAAAFALLALSVNLAAASLSLVGFVWYVGVYTVWLKRRTPHNIVIGGAAGAIPPMVGWAAVQGGFAWESLYLFAIVFAWTAPHFWALALLMKDDYARVGIPMLPVVRGEDHTRRAIVAWAWVTVATSLLPVVGGVFGPIYLAAALVLDAELLRRCRALLRDGGRQRALSLHLYALIYLAVLFGAMVLDGRLG